MSSHCIWSYWPCIVLNIWSNDKSIFAHRAVSIFSGQADSTSTNPTGQTHCLRAVNCVCVSPHQEWVGSRDGSSVVGFQNNYRCCANHDTKLTDDIWYMMIGVGGISMSDRYDLDMPFVTTCRWHYQLIWFLSMYFCLLFDTDWIMDRICWKKFLQYFQWI